MEISSEKPAKGNNAIAEFFKQSFRRHGGGEYSELLTRGVQKGNRQGLNRKYPWAYLRLFTLTFVLFAIFLLIIRFTSNELFVPTVTLLGATCFNLTFLLFLFELYPKKDLSFLAVCLAMLIGGACSNVIAQVLFSVFKPSNGWLHAVYAGFFEELSKAVATVLIIIISRRSSPLSGFVFGAAVGCGFSIAEDMGYIFMEANAMPFVNLTTVIELSVARGLTAVCTHTLWTAAIGWAYCHFSRHLANIAVHLITLLSCGLHICWDLPLGNFWSGFIYAACASVVCVETILILHCERKKVFGNISSALESSGSEVERESERDETESLSKTDPKYWRYWGHFTLSLAAFLMAVIAVIYCAIPFRETYGTQTFENSENFVAFMHNGMELNTEDRLYDYTMGYSSYTEENGVLVKVVQQEVSGEITYNYEYTVSYDFVSDKYYYYPARIWITIETPTGQNSFFRNEIRDKKGELWATYFAVNGDVTGYNFRDEEMTVITYNPAFERDLTEWRYLALFCALAAISGAAITCYVSLVIKARRVKKLCTTKDVSSAE